MQCCRCWFLRSYFGLKALARLRGGTSRGLKMGLKGGAIRGGFKGGLRGA